MDKKNVIFNESMESYSKKYKNRKYRLLKYSKKDVDAFDKANNTKGFLLKNRKWALIKDTYYEIPKSPRLTWFRNLHAGTQIATCLLGAGVVAAGVTVPVVLINQRNAIIENTSDIEVSKEGDGADLIQNPIFKKQANGDYVATIKVAGGHSKSEIDEIEVYVDGKQLEYGTEYEYNYKTSKLTIKSSAVPSPESKVKLKVKKREEEPKHIEGVEIYTVGGATEVKKGEKLQLYFELEPKGAVASYWKWGIIPPCEDNTIDEDGLFTANTAGTYTIYVYVEDEDGYNTQNTFDITVTEDVSEIEISGDRNLEVSNGGGQYYCNVAGVNWSIEDGEDIATIDNTGKLTITNDGLKTGGTVVIKAYLDDSNYNTYEIEIGTFTGLDFSHQDENDNILVCAEGITQEAREKIKNEYLVIPSQYYDDDSKDFIPVKGLFCNDDLQEYLGAFEYCGCQNVHLPDTITSIDYCAFKDCKELLSINISKNVNSINEEYSNAFTGCVKLSKFNVDEQNPKYTNKDFGEPYLFEKLDNGKYKLVSFCYQNAEATKKLLEIFVGGKINSLGKSAFAKSYVVDGESLKTILEYVEDIPDYCFAGINILNTPKVTIPSNVLSIGNNAFENCNLTSVDFDENSYLYSFGDEAFKKCNSLTSVTIPERTTSIGGDSFKNTSLNSATFKYVDGWNANFTEIKSSDLSNTSTAADYLSNVYCACHWSREALKLDKFIQVYREKLNNFNNSTFEFKSPTDTIKLNGNVIVSNDISYKNEDGRECVATFNISGTDTPITVAGGNSFSIATLEKNIKDILAKTTGATEEIGTGAEGGIKYTITKDDTTIYEIEFNKYGYCTKLYDKTSSIDYTFSYSRDPEETDKEKFTRIYKDYVENYLKSIETNAYVSGDITINSSKSGEEYPTPFVLEYVNNQCNMKYIYYKEGAPQLNVQFIDSYSYQEILKFLKDSSGSVIYDFNEDGSISYIDNGEIPETGSFLQKLKINKYGYIEEGAVYKDGVALYDISLSYNCAPNTKMGDTISWDSESTSYINQKAIIAKKDEMHCVGCKVSENGINTIHILDSDMEELLFNGNVNSISIKIEDGTSVDFDISEDGKQILLSTTISNSNIVIEFKTDTAIKGFYVEAYNK